MQHLKDLPNKSRVALAMTDQEHADAIRAAAKALDAAIKAAVSGGLTVHVSVVADLPISCGFIRHVGIQHVEVIRAINPA